MRIRIFLMLSLLTIFVRVEVQAQEKGRLERENQVLAIIGGTKEIRARDVEALFPLEARNLRERFDALNKVGLETLITRAVLEVEAERRGTTPDELLRAMVPDRIDVKRIDIEREYLESGRGMGVVDEAQAKALLRIQLEAQSKIAALRSAVAELRRGARVEIRRSDEVSDSAREGSVVLVIFTDFECPFCRRAHEVVDRIRKEYGESLSVVYKHLPLSNHRRAFAAAVASECAGRQGRFWDYADRLFGVKELTESELKRQAEALDLDLNRFQTCLGSDSAADVILGSMREARNAGIEATPSFVLNGRILKGLSSYEALKDEIDQAIRLNRAVKNKD